MAPHELQALIVQVMQGRGDHVSERLAPLRRRRVESLDNVADGVKCQKRLPALEFDRGVRRRCLQDVLDRLFGNLQAHVEAMRGGVWAARDLTVATRMVTAQRHHEDVELRPFKEEPLAASVLQCHAIQRQSCVPRRQEVAALQQRVRRVIGVHFVTHESLELLAVQNGVLTDLVNQKDATCIETPETEWQQPVFGRWTKVGRRLKTSHAAQVRAARVPASAAVTRASRIPQVSSAIRSRSASSTSHV